MHKSGKSQTKVRWRSNQSQEEVKKKSRKGQGMVIQSVTFGLHYIRRYIGLHHFFLLSPHTKAHVRYNLVSLLCTIWSRLWFMYDTISWFFRVRYQSLSHRYYNINLWATATTILSIRGVQIPIDLVSSATDSSRRSVVLFKTMSIPTSDPKSEFLCQSSFLAQNLQTPLESPCTPGISPTPSSPRITRTVIVRVLLLSTWSRNSVCNGRSDLVVACQLKSSRVFNLNVTQSQ